MALVGDPVGVGLDVIRIRFGENAYRFVMRFARTKKTRPDSSRKLGEVGALCGLNAKEIEEASNGSNETTEYPTWIAVVLFIIASIAISWSFIMWQHATYTPGTWYASLSPNDFEKTIGLHCFAS